MATYYPVTLAEMRNFLEPMGFQQVDVGRDVREIVFSKGMRGFNFDGARIPIAIRVYTGINLSDVRSRANGSDAIRVSVWIKIDNKPMMLHGQQRVHRVEGWRTNLENRIKSWKNTIGEVCPECGAPMTIKINGRTGEPLMGCVRYRMGCRGTRPCECKHEKATARHATCPDCGANLKEKRSPRI